MWTHLPMIRGIEDPSVVQHSGLLQCLHYLLRGGDLCHKWAQNQGQIEGLGGHLSRFRGEGTPTIRSSTDSNDRQLSAVSNDDSSVRKKLQSTCCRNSTTEAATWQEPPTGRSSVSELISSQPSAVIIRRTTGRCGVPFYCRE